MKFLLFIFAGVHLLPLNSGKATYRHDNSQRTFQEIKDEIAHYGDVAKAIINLAVYGKAQNRSYERLALLVDTVGPRLSGSKSLEKAIQIMYQNLKEDGLENVHLEPVKIPHWERGEESAMMLEPRMHKMAILGLGSSIGTPPEGITAEVLLVTSFNELQRRASEARGKIVVYNQPYTNYSRTVQYRVKGAVEAAKVGALASLIRSVASFSIYSPHTGVQEYQDGVPKIPTACITVEDAEMMSRMVSRGSRIIIQLKMGAKNYPDANSFNTVAEIVGSKYPDQVNISKYSLVMESDLGTFIPSGLQFTGSEKARAIIKEVMSLLQPINVTQVFSAGEGTDINFWIQAGVPGASLLDDLYKYFSFHHSNGDTMTVMDPKQMNIAAALWTVVSYVVADMEEMLPRS
uniref:Carboxypeptidase Q n=1 Tax=Rousettus aegyptiacus TaxID=9407 RepID=A0A7J8C1B1_ROUAE|nr:carboxypeptidase Q [Rousettus aegyptiacus]